MCSGFGLLCVDLNAKKGKALGNNLSYEISIAAY